VTVADGSLRVTDNPAEQRYEAWAGDELAGFAAYQKADRLVVFTHTEVEPAFEGKGVGSTLVREALDDVRRLGLPVLPICPFVQGWIAKHPDYHDLDYRRPESRVSD
jgi:predicted GNAT family acetyltransferase